MPSLRSVKCSLHAPRSRSHQRHHSAFRASHLAQHRLLPAHLPTTNATPAPQQHSRTNLTPHSSPSVVPLPSPRTLQLQHTTAVHQGAHGRQGAVERLAVSVASQAPTRQLGPSASRAARLPRRSVADSPRASSAHCRSSAQRSRPKIRVQGLTRSFALNHPNGSPHIVICQPPWVVLWRISGKRRRWGSLEIRYAWWARQGLNL